MPAANGSSPAQSAQSAQSALQPHPWWSSSRPQTPPKRAIDAHSHYTSDADEDPMHNPFPLRSTSHQGRSMSRSRSEFSQNGVNGTMAELAPLQDRDMVDGASGYDPIADDNPTSYDLLAPTDEDQKKEYSLERRSLVLFSREHLQVIFDDPALLFRFTAFMTSKRPQSLPMLVYYLDTLKAIRAVHYANAIAQGLEFVKGHDCTSKPIGPTVNESLEQRAREAFDILVREDLPAYITSLYIQIVSLSITRRVTGSLDPRLREASEGLAEVFCLTDPSRPDNPIVFSSDEFNRTTQYGMTYALGRNCRFLQGPSTDQDGIRRIRTAVKEERHHEEVLLNYRRDGSPFMNLLMIAPLFDSRGKLRYFIGAQVDVSGLVKECVELESLQRLLVLHEKGHPAPDLHKASPERNGEFQDLCEMFNVSELSTVRRNGGRMHQDASEEGDTASLHSQQPRLMLREPLDSAEYHAVEASGKLGGAYANFLLVRPYPSLRILFASPSQRLPGILQSPFLDKIGGSPRVREELTAAFADGRGVTAKVRWLSRNNEQGRSRWIHCTPLLGISGQIGVWMVVIVDDEKHASPRTWRPAPPIPSSVAASIPNRSINGRGRGSFEERNGSVRNGFSRSQSPNSMRLG